MFSKGGEGAPPQSEGVLEGANIGQQQSDSDKLARANEIAWLQVATLAEQSNDLAKAADAYNHVLLTNSRNVHALLQLASISRMQERFEDAVDYLNRIMVIDGPTGEVYGAIGHCYLTLSQRTQDLDMTLDCLRKCYDAYHEASLHLGALNDPNLWYGIGLLYERYANLMLPGVGQSECFSAAEESLRSVLQAAPEFEKRSEILYRLGHIYKAQENPHRALECFQAICDAPPPPLTQADVWFLIGSVQETMEPPAPEFARQAYVHVLRLMQLNEEAKVARVYRQLGWVCHKFALDQPPLLGILNPAEAQAQSPLLCLKRALETEPMDAPNWHMLGACLLDHRELDAAYDCLRHAITLEPTSDKAWRSVGDLYLAQGEREDAIEAYEQAVHLNPSSHAWFDLGAARHDALAVSGAGATSMITAAVEAYTRALTICPDRREDISRRLQHLNTISVNTSMPSVSAADAGCAAKTAPAAAASDEGPSILHAAAVH
ncbi:glucose repression mediator, partial [Chrysochromulina tobinii]